MNDIFGNFRQKPVYLLSRYGGIYTVGIGKLTSGENAGRLFYIEDERATNPGYPGGVRDGLLPQEFSGRETVTAGEIMDALHIDRARYQVDPHAWLLPPDTVLRITEDAVAEEKAEE